MQGFPERGSTNHNLLFDQMFAENCIKWKKLDRKMVFVRSPPSLDAPMICSVTTKYVLEIAYQTQFQKYRRYSGFYFLSNSLKSLKKTK